MNALDDFKQWLVGQLPPAKAHEQSWTDLAKSLAESIYNHVDVFLERLKDRNSLYDMAPEDLLKDSEELRKVFPIQDVSEVDMPHVIMQRRDEVHFKKTVYPMIATLAREFRGMPVKWEPLYAPINQDSHPYGTLFATEDELSDFIGLDPDDFFLTSRGVIRIPIDEVQVNENGVDDQAIIDFEARVRRVIYPLFPLRIVCDGMVYFIQIEMKEFIDFISFVRSDVDTILEDKDKALESMQYSELSPVNSKARTTDQVHATPSYGTPRFGAIPMGAIPLDRVYY